MAEEPETTAPETAIERIEAAAEEAIAAVKAAPIDVLTAIHAHIDALKEDIRANVSGEIPTTAHNKLMALAETLRSKVVGLF